MTDCSEVLLVSDSEMQCFSLSIPLFSVLPVTKEINMMFNPNFTYFLGSPKTVEGVDLKLLLSFNSKGTVIYWDFS